MKSGSMIWQEGEALKAALEQRFALADALWPFDAVKASFGTSPIPPNASRLR
jgi:hypothetical protein